MFLLLPAYSVALYAGTHLLNYDNTITPGLGEWAEDIVTYHSTISSPGIGQDLVIQLYSGGDQVDFDKVSLNEVPVPPSALLFGTGLIPLVWVRRKKRLGQ